jgi:F-type H+-transporting ATPase subunit gamma
MIRQQWGGVFDRLSFEHALDIGQNIVSQSHEGTFDQLYVVYNEFKSVMQQAIVEKLLPIESVQESGGREKPETVGGYLYEPDENESLETLLIAETF